MTASKSMLPPSLRLRWHTASQRPLSWELLAERAQGGPALACESYIHLFMKYFLSRNGNQPGWGDNNNGFGLMQVDIGSWTPTSTTDIDNIDQGTEILAGMLTVVQGDQTIPAAAACTTAPADWSSVWQLRAAVAAYNFGADDVWCQATIDRGSSSTCTPCDGNYSWDTMNRARWFADNA